MRLLLVVLTLGSSWGGTWTNDATGTSGAATLNGGTLRLAGSALGCAQPVLLTVRVRGSRLDGRGHSVPCSRGLRWSIAGTVGDAVIQLRLADGSSASVRLALQRR
jgi:hypothetical protein